jgi:hypothetical protein
MFLLRLIAAWEAPLGDGLRNVIKLVPFADHMGNLRAAPHIMQCVCHFNIIWITTQR